jgi:nucleoid DNA-binding protein
MALSPELLKLVKSSKNKHTRTGNSVSLKEGKTTIRILAKGADQFWFDFAVHWIKTEKNGKPVAVVGCKDEVFGEPCAICTAIAQATAQATDQDEIDLIKEWKAKKGVLVNALVRSGPDKSESPQIVELKPTVWAEIAGMIAEYQESDVDLLDALKGQDFIIERRGKNLDTKYSVMLAPKSAPVPAEAFDAMHDLKAYVEAQYFRGDETKALTAIANVTGVSVSVGNQIAAPRRSAMLSAPAATVVDAEVAAAVEAELAAEDEVIEAVVEEVVEVVAEAVETDEERDRREFREFKAMQAAKAAAVKPAPAAAAPVARAKPVAAPVKPKPTAVAAPATVPADDFDGALPADEIDALLGELDVVK